MRSSSSNSRAAAAVLASEGTSTSGVAAAHFSGKPGVVGGPSAGPEPTCEKQVGAHGSSCTPAQQVHFSWSAYQRKELTWAQVGKVQVCKCQCIGAQAGSVEVGAAGKDAASDEELARRLHAQLNGEALALAVRRRTRKQPSFYTPQVPPTAVACYVEGVLEICRRRPYGGFQGALFPRGTSADEVSLRS